MATTEPQTSAGILVVAGPNGGGKSSIGGEAVRSAGGEYFNPDEYARRLRELQPNLTEMEANSQAWAKGVAYLEEAIAQGTTFAFETTLGASTIPRLLREAAEHGHRVRIWYVALESADLHVERVARRVESGGHPIPEEDIRRRYDRSRLNLVDLLLLVDEVKVFDNSLETADQAPLPVLVLHVRSGRVIEVLPLSEVPTWAKPIVAAAVAERDDP